MDKREFVGSWLMVFLLGLIYIVPGIVYWLVNRRPRYLINHDCMMHANTGRLGGAAARMGGIQGAIFEFFANIGEWGWLVGFVFMITFGIILSPVFMVLAYKQNYLDVEKEVLQSLRGG